MIQLGPVRFGLGRNADTWALGGGPVGVLGPCTRCRRPAVVGVAEDGDAGADALVIVLRDEDLSGTVRVDIGDHWCFEASQVVVLPVVRVAL